MSDDSSPHGEQTLERVRAALISAGMGIWEWDTQTGYMSWDGRMHSHFGLAEGAFDQRYESFLARIAAEDRAGVAQHMQAVAAGGGEYDGEFRVLAAPGATPRFFRLRFTRGAEEVRDGSPRVTGMCWDISDRRQAEQQLVAKENLLTTLMDHLPDHIYFKDLESRFVAVNRAMSAYNGEVEPRDMVGRTDFDYFSEDHARKAFADEQKVIATGFPLLAAMEKETKPDGPATWVSTSKLPWRDASGTIIGTFGLSRDMTSRKRAEEQLANLADELRAKNEALEEDLAMARELQHALLPQQYPRFPHSAANDGAALRFFHFFTPSASVSGDFFDVLDVSSSLAGIFVCDVMGHGVRAALVAAIIRTLVHDLKAFWDKPAEFLTRLNHELRSTLRDTQTPIFASAFYAVVDIEKGEVNFANAGHPKPLLVNPNDRRTRPLNGVKHGPALGLFDETRYKASRESLAAQDVMLLFTDGLFEVEGHNGRHYDYAALLESVSRRRDLPSETLCGEVISEIKQFSASKEFNDDVCLVAVEFDHLHPKALRP
jgi:sigma-B regulation protein RsbU (phosphoserine phosphatase)